MKKVLFLITLSILISLVTIVSACAKKNASKPLLAKPVEVQIVYRYDVPYQYTYPAIVQGVIDYPVIPRVSGAIFKQYYTEGTYVKKDTPLYQIDPRPFELDLQNFQGQLIKDTAAMINYKLIYERYQRLYKINAVSKQDVELATINYQAAVGNVKTDQANVNQAKLNLEYAVVRAPADGYIAERQVTVGDMVTAFQSVLNQINSVNDMYIVFAMPENDRLLIQKGIASSVINVPRNYRFRMDLELADKTMLKNAGYIEFTDTRISLATGVWNMRGYVDNKQLRSQLLAGQFVNVYLNGIYYKNSYTVPQEAIFRDDQGAFVYIVKENKVARQAITLGQMNNDQWIIAGGLSDKMAVITAGGINVNVGDTVKIDKTLDQLNLTKNTQMVDKNPPSQVTPPKINASGIRTNKQQKVQIQDSADLYPDTY